jgi:hypothetical protein
MYDRVILTKLTRNVLPCLSKGDSVEGIKLEGTRFQKRFVVVR